MKIFLHQHPFSGEPPQQFEADSLALWLVERYERGPRVNVQVFAGEPSAETEISGNEAAILTAAAPAYTVLESPGGPIAPILINLAISMVLSAAMTFLFAKDKSLDNRAQESPNNQLSNRENRVRALERVEDIYGTVRSIPSLMMQTYAKYLAHRKVEYGYYCIGRGYYDISDVRDGDTALSEISGASAAIYAPFTSPNSGSPQLLIGDAIIDPIVSVVRSSGVDGVVMKPTNQLQLEAGADYYFFGPGSGYSGPWATVPANSGDTIYQLSTNPNFTAVCEVGQSLTITIAPFSADRIDTTGLLEADAATKTYTSTVTGFFRGVGIGTTCTVAGFADPANNGVKTVVSVSDQVLTVAEVLVDEVVPNATFTVDIYYSGVRTIASVQPNYITLSGTSFSPLDYPLGESVDPFDPGGVVATLEVDNGLVDWTDWYTLPDASRTEVWTNVLARGGMYKDDGAKSATSVAYEVQIEQLTALLVPTGVVETVTGNISGATSNERAETLERVTAWTGPARVRARRTTPFDYSFSGLVVDEIQWVDLYGVAPVSKAHFGNKTTVHTITRANADATTLRRRELNCLASRKLPTYNGTSFSGVFDGNGLLASGTISATSRMVDIIAAVCADPRIGYLTRVDPLEDSVDMAQIWSVQQALDAWNSECGQFNYTFDSDNISFEETVDAIANAAFCKPYRQNGKIRLALDRPQASSVALFTHRNKRPSGGEFGANETITRTFANDSEYDGVELVYMDPETETQETIRLPLDGSYTKLKKVEVTGIRSYTQAWFRANREYRRLLNQRISIETDTTTDARALLPNSRVEIVDNTRFKSWDGEVVGQSGLTLTLSREVEFIPAVAHSIVLMKRDGSVQSIACTAGASANQVVLAGAPAEAVVTTPTAEDGIRTIFSFAADSARAAQAYLVQEIGTTEGQYVRLRAVNYSDDYYAADSEAVPAKAGVIN